MNLIKKIIEFFNKEEKVTVTYTKYVDSKLRIQMFKDKKNKWRFRILGKNHKILCSSEAYSRKCYCQDTVFLIMRSKLYLVLK